MFFFLFTTEQNAHTRKTTLSTLPSETIVSCVDVVFFFFYYKNWPVVGVGGYLQSLMRVYDVVWKGGKKDYENDKRMRHSNGEIHKSLFMRKETPRFRVSIQRKKSYKKQWERKRDVDCVSHRHFWFSLFVSSQWILKIRNVGLWTVNSKFVLSELCTHRWRTGLSESLKRLSNLDARQIVSNFIFFYSKLMQFWCFENFKKSMIFLSFVNNCKIYLNICQIMEKILRYRWKYFQIFFFFFFKLMQFLRFENDEKIQQIFWLLYRS